MISHIILIIKNKRIRSKNMTSRGSLQYQYAGLILIMSAYNKRLVHVKLVSIENLSINIKGHDMKPYQFFVVPIGN